MLAIIRRLRITRIGARLRGIALALAEGKVLIAHIASRRWWRVDCTTKFRRTAEASASCRRGVFVVGFGGKVSPAQVTGGTFTGVGGGWIYIPLEPAITT